MITRLLAGSAIFIFNLGAAVPTQSQTVVFPFERMPSNLWAQELVWLHTIGLTQIEVPKPSAELAALAVNARLGVVAEVAEAERVSAFQPDAILLTRRAMLDRKPVVWTDVETEVSPVYRRGAVTLAGEEEPGLKVLRRDAALRAFWGPVLAEGVARKDQGLHLPDSLSLEELSLQGASALSVINSAKVAWRGDLRAYVPSLKRDVQIQNVTVSARDALFLPVDVALADPQFCRFCSGMSNSERLLYATAELTGIEYENGILSFEFYAPTPGFAILQLEREPNGPMLAGGRLVAFDWDSDNKRAKLPIPAGKGSNRKTRIAITITAPDDVASFVDTRTLVIGQTNHVLTDYSSEELAKRSRLIVPEGWKATSEVRSLTEIAYSVEVPKNRLHGDHEELRLEADGVGMSHVRVQLLRPVSVHVAEAIAVHFGAAAELVTDPPLVPVEAPNGRNITIQVRNNAPEIRTFQVEVTGGGLEFSPAKTEISIGASMERDISVRVFASRAEPGIHTAVLRITGPVEYEQSLRLVMIPRGGTTEYASNLTNTPGQEFIWENTRIRAVFAAADGGRWLEFFWKESGRSLLPVEGVPLSAPVKVELRGDELILEGSTALPEGGKIGNVEWRAESHGARTIYKVTEATSK